MTHEFSRIFRMFSVNFSNVEFFEFRIFRMFYKFFCREYSSCITGTFIFTQYIGAEDKLDALAFAVIAKVGDNVIAMKYPGIYIYINIISMCTQNRITKYVGFMV